MEMVEADVRVVDVVVSQLLGFLVQTLLTSSCTYQVIFLYKSLLLLSISHSQTVSLLAYKIHLSHKSFQS